MVRDSEYSNELIAGCNPDIIKQSGCYESIEDHLRGAKYVLSNFLDNYIVYTDNVLEKLLNIKLSTSIVYLAVALHDLGKSLPHYQQKLRKTCTAPYHEVASIALLKLIDLSDVVIRGNHKALMVILMLSIIMHHHAMRPLSYIARNLDVSLNNALPTTLHINDIVSSCKKYIDVVKRIFNIELGIKTKCKEVNIANLRRDVTVFIDKLRDIFKSNEYTFVRVSNYIYKISILVLKPLLIADIVSASVNRSCTNIDLESLNKVIEKKSTMVSDVIERNKVIKSVSNKLRVYMKW